MVQPGADAVERRRNMLAHPGSIRTTAGELDLLRRREQAGIRQADPFHHTFGEPALQKLDERIDRASAVLADGFPARLCHWRDFHRNLVNLRAAHQGLDLARTDLKI